MAIKPFAHGNAATVTEAVEALSASCRPLAGGTDLVARMKADLTAPESLVNLKTIPELQGIAKTAEGLRIGAMVTLSQLAAHLAMQDRPEPGRENRPELGRGSLTRSSMAVLYQSILQSASPQLRHMATLGGNLLQEPRCWYYRNNLIPCWRKGGRLCYAYRGENERHVILGGGPCYAVHPSDPAVALLAMDASLRIVGPAGERTTSLAEFYHPPDHETRTVTHLAVDELITDIFVPAPQPGTRGVYVKVAERATWDFALAAVAIQAVMEGDTIRSCRVALGGVATIPWHAPQVEEILAGRSLSTAVIDRAAEAVVDDVRPLEHNGYKADLLQGLLREALDQLH
jgi:xanthine dehydrogenase YagS FAD-binding subunit